MNCKTLKWVTPALAVVGVVGLTPATSAHDFQRELIVRELSAPKGITGADFRMREGLMEKYLFVAESGADRILKISPDGSLVTPFSGPMYNFPVGVACYGNGFAQDLYVGNAIIGNDVISHGGVHRFDAMDGDMPFALPDVEVAGMDFGYCEDLFVGEWQAGNIWRIDPLGNATLFAQIPGEARYLKFGNRAFGGKLYVTEFWTGDIYVVDKFGNVQLFTSIGGPPGLEGLEFAPGGAFGHFMYVGNLNTGEIFRVSPTGFVTLFTDELPGAADIFFTTLGTAKVFMYVVDGQTPGGLWRYSAL